MTVPFKWVSLKGSRKELFDLFVKKQLTTREDFYAAVPMALRQHTDGKQMQFLDDILEFIEEHGS